MGLRAGVDMIEIARIEKSLANPRFLERVFSAEERSEYARRGQHPSYLAGCFCVKEAFSKAIGTGIRDFKLTEVAVLRDELGKPYLSLRGAAQRIAEEEMGLAFDVSISHTEKDAIAFVVAYPRDERGVGI